MLPPRNNVKQREKTSSQDGKKSTEYQSRYMYKPSLNL